ncbi:MAG: hypothetical protein ICV79_11770 [Flavisolibacter sp.]|nr:hypothetical protein [Flavisolibacter sp.]
MGSHPGADLDFIAHQQGFKPIQPCIGSFDDRALLVKLFIEIDLIFFELFFISFVVINVAFYFFFGTRLLQLFCITACIGIYAPLLSQ